MASNHRTSKSGYDLQQKETLGLNDQNINVELPIAERDYLTQGMLIKELLAHPVWGQHVHEFRFAYGQPKEVREAFLKAAGI